MEEPAEPVVASPLGYVPDLMVDNSILECAGLGFGEEESYLLMNSLKVFWHLNLTLTETFLIINWMLPESLLIK